MARISYERRRFAPAFIHYAVWLYFRFTLRPRAVGEMLAHRGIDVSYDDPRLHCEAPSSPTCRRAGACEVRGPNPLAEASNWHRNIGALSTAIGMEFVQYEVLRIRGSPDDIAVQCILPRQKHFQHHEVSE